MSRVGFLGTGHIAAPMARALARKGHAITVSERNAEVAADLADAGLGIVVAPNQQVLDASDAVIVSLRPAVWQTVMPGLNFRADHAVLSVMAGVPLEALAAACAPATNLSIFLPLGFVEQGGCPLPVLGDPAALTALFGADNPVLPVADAAALTAHFAASTSVSAVLVAMQAAMDWLADRTGDADGAEVYVSNLIAGYLRALDKAAAGDLARDLAGLASPNTLNRRMVDAMQANGLAPALGDTLTATAAHMESKA
jgi:pyrroline-5-carboxylate reductase